MTREELIESLWNEYGEAITQNTSSRAMRGIMETAFTLAINAALEAQRNELEPYCAHESDCPLAMWSEGRPTEDGGYEFAYGYGSNKRWYPKGEYPPCTCGLLKALEGEVTE